MAGTETKDFDLVFEFSEDAITGLLSVFFDEQGIINSIFGTSVFDLRVRMDQPSDAPGADNAIDVNIDVGESGALAAVRLVAGIDVERGSDADSVQINFEDKLFLIDVQILGDLPLVSDLAEAALRNLLRNDVRRLPILPDVAVDRGTSDPMVLKEIDVKVIDDTGGDDRDALAALLSFGGALDSRDKDAFARSVIDSPNTGAIMVFFKWICRIIEPRLEEELDIPADEMVDCVFDGRVTIDDDEDIDLTHLSLTLDGDAIVIRAKVGKSGFCYSAEGEVSARLTAAVVPRAETTDRAGGGRLRINAEIGDPDIDLDIPWYCYVVGALVGALLGALIGVISAIIGAVIVPLVMWILSELLEGLFDDIADAVVTAIDNALPSVDVPAVGFEVIFQDAFIDDITVDAKIAPLERVAIRNEGTVTLRRGDLFDFDSATKGREGLFNADLECSSLAGPGLKAVCAARIGNTSLRRMDDVRRFLLYRPVYQRGRILPFDALARLDVNIFDGFSLFEPRDQVFAFSTNSGRFGAFEVIDASLDRLVIRYRTYELFQASVQIEGGFACGGPSKRWVLDDAKTWKGSTVVFEPAQASGSGARILNAGASHVYQNGTIKESRAAAPGECPGDEDKPTAMTRRATLAGGVESAQGAIVRAVAGSDQPELAAAVAELERYPLGRDVLVGGRIGQWTTTLEQRVERGRFDAVVSGVKGELGYRWSINGIPLDRVKGEVNIQGAAFRYETNLSRLALEVDSEQELPFQLVVEVRSSETAETLRAAQCVTYKPTCREVRRVKPEFTVYRAAFAERFGTVPMRVAAPVAATLKDR
jgi:hypothetical protein